MAEVEEKTVEDYFKDVFNELKALRKESSETRVHLNSLTKEVNQQGSAINAKPTPTGKGGNKGGGGGAIEMIAKAFDKGINFLTKNPDIFFGKDEKKDPMYEKHKELVDKAFVANIENTIELGKLTVKKAQAEIDRVAKTGWNVL